MRWPSRVEHLWLKNVVFPHNILFLIRLKFSQLHFLPLTITFPLAYETLFIFLLWQICIHLTEICVWDLHLFCSWGYFFSISCEYDERKKENSIKIPEVKMFFLLNIHFSLEMDDERFWCFRVWMAQIYKSRYYVIIILKTKGCEGRRCFSSCFKSRVIKDEKGRCTISHSGILEICIILCRQRAISCVL